MFRSIIHLLLLTVWITSCHAFSPQLDNIFPRGAQRGTSTELHFHGDRLNDAKEILTYRPGISFAAITVHDPKHISAVATMTADCPLGEHQFRIRSESGISEMKILLIGQFPAVTEIEPNNTFDAPQTINLNSTIHGIVKNEDEDFFAVHLTKGQRLSAEVEAIRLGQEMFDAYVAILDPKRFELSAKDDSPLLRTDAFAAIVAPEDGIYRVLVREAAYQGSDNCHYRLHISIAPRPSAVFPTGAKPGETIEFTFLADPSGPIKQTITLPESTSSPFAVFCQADGLSAPSPNWIILHPLDYANEAEPNETQQQATPLPPAPCAAQGIIQQDGDIDWFKFPAKKGQTFSIKAHALTLRSPLDTVLNLHDINGKNLLNNDDQGSLDSSINWDCPADGEYLLRIADKLLKGAPDFVYRIEVKPRAPAISAALPVVERVLSQKWKMLPIPRGNRYATVVNFTRENIGCNLQLHALSLPAGVTMHAPPVPKGTTSFPVMFESTADAPIAGGLHTIQVKSGGDGAPADLTGPLNERIEHVDVNNQGSYHGTTVDRISMAVIQDVPLRIDLTPPTVPIVRNGTLPLTVKITRTPGYNDPFTLRFLWSPPGIGAPVTIDVPKDATEVIYPINANNEAALGTWPIVLLAEAKCPTGPFLVSSNLANITIAEPFLSATIDLCATEQGKPTPLLAKLDITTPFEGNATAELMGLPHGTKSRNITFHSTAKEITFPLEIAADATIGKHQSLFLKILIPQQGQQISHQLAQGSTLRIDAPHPVAAPATSPTPSPTANTPPPSPPTQKPLSRLEQLRQKK
jgi:hypothetical protein